MVVTNRAVGWLTDTPTATTLRSDCFLLAITAIIRAMTWEPMLALAAVPYLIGVVVMAVRPDIASLSFPFVIVAGGATVAAVFGRTMGRPR